MNEEDKIELKSDEIREILTRPPHWLIRWGISLIAAIILGIFVMSFFFRYPEVVQSDVTITTENPPVWIVARSTGTLKELRAGDKQPVRAGQLVAVLENPARTADVESMKKILGSCATLSDSLVLRLDLPSDLELGTLQTVYAAFRKALSDYRSFLSLGLYERKIGAARAQLKGYESYVKHLQNQVSLNKKGIELAEKDHNREKQLYAKKLSSEVALEQSDKSLLTVRQGAEQAMTSASTARIEASRLESSITELELERQQEARRLRTDLRSAYDNLQASLKSWELTYLLCSPSGGILSYNEIWKPGQNVNTGDKVFSVVSNAPGKLIGRVKIPVEGSRKVKPGQEVNIKVNGFPYMEYGFLTGKVISVSLLANENVYSAVISLPGKLETSYHQELPFTGELAGSAEIITEDLSVARRILNPLRYVFQKNFGRQPLEKDL